MKNIMITGGAGFIGSNLVKFMIRKYPECNIVVYDKFTYAADKDNLKEFIHNKNFTIVEDDICKYQSVYDVICYFKIDTIIHLAAESHVDNSILSPGTFIKTNILGTYNLLEAARQAWEPDNFVGKRFHHVSTDEVYGSLSLLDEPFTETTSYDPRSPYSASKASSDHLVMAYYHTYGLPVTISNCSNNYGPNQHKEKLIPKTIKALIDGEQITVYGNGKNVRDWLFVVDHAFAIDDILHKGKIGETYNIGGNNEMSNIEIISTIVSVYEEITGNKVRSDFIKFVEDRKGHDFRYAIDFSKLTNETQWRPTTDFKIGLKITIKYYIKKFTNND